MTNPSDNQNDLIFYFSELKGGLKNVEIALWANDYSLAYLFLKKIEDDQKPLLESISSLREKILDARKNAKDSIDHTMSRHQGLKKWQQEFIREYYFEEQQADIVQQQQVEYELIPLQYQIERYKRRIEEVFHLGKTSASSDDDISQSILDRYKYISIDQSDGQTTYRLYRFEGQINLSPQKFLENLEKELDSKPQIVDSIVDSKKLTSEWNQVFPLWLRLFSTEFFIEITIFDHNCAEVSIITQPDQSSEKIIDDIISVLSNGES